MAPAAKAKGEGKSKKAEKTTKSGGKEAKEKRVTKPSAYLHFGKVMRPKLKEDEPDLPQKEYMGRIAEMWRELSDKDKKKYETLRDKEWEKSGGPAKLAEYQAKKKDEKSSGKKSAKKAEKKPASKKKKEEEPEDDEEDEDDAEEEAPAADEEEADEDDAADGDDE